MARRTYRVPLCCMTTPIPAVVPIFGPPTSWGSVKPPGAGVPHFFATWEKGALALEETRVFCSFTGSKTRRSPTNQFPAPHEHSLTNRLVASPL